MQVSSYMSSTGLAAVGAVALAGLFSWGVNKMSNRGEEERFRRGSGRSEIVYEDNEFNREVLGRCGTILSVYRRFWGIWNEHVETIWGSWFRRDPGVKYVRELLPRPDGGTVAIDYFDPEDKPVRLDGRVGNVELGSVSWSIRIGNKIGTGERIDVSRFLAV